MIQCVFFNPLLLEVTNNHCKHTTKVGGSAARAEYEMAGAPGSCYWLRRLLGGVYQSTLPETDETDCLHLKMDGWNARFLKKMSLLAQGRTVSFVEGRALKV